VVGRPRPLKTDLFLIPSSPTRKGIDHTRKKYPSIYLIMSARQRCLGSSHRQTQTARISFPSKPSFLVHELASECPDVRVLEDIMRTPHCPPVSTQFSYSRLLLLSFFLSFSLFFLFIHSHSLDRLAGLLLLSAVGIARVGRCPLFSRLKLSTFSLPAVAWHSLLLLFALQYRY